MVAIESCSNVYLGNNHVAFNAQQKGQLNGKNVVLFPNSYQPKSTLRAGGAEGIGQAISGTFQALFYGGLILSVATATLAVGIATRNPWKALYTAGYGAGILAVGALFFKVFQFKQK